MVDFERIERKENKVFNILAVGRLVEQKGFIYLVDACGMLEEQAGLNYKCRIIGEGNERARLETAIADLGIAESVELLGAREQSEVVRYMNEADVFVLPCVAESNGTMDGIPVALMEAMAKGIPVISTTISGIPELILDGTGKLIPPGDSKGLANMLLEINRMSLSQKNQMGVEARRIVFERFNISKEAQKLKPLILS
jgi:glycosyltransferase involved in cell wall biosynthesis